MKYLIYLSIIVLSLSSCGRRLDEIVVKNDEGTIVEQYYINKDSLRYGTYTSFDADGNVFEKSQYKAGNLDGERLIYYKDGTVEIKENYVDGTMQGSYQSFYKNGQLELDALYVDGAMEGVLKRYYDSGELLEEVTFKGNEENGPFKEYYKNGQVKWEGNYIDGDNEVGLIKSYDESGALIKKMECGKYQGDYICQTVWTLEEGDKPLVIEYEE